MEKTSSLRMKRKGNMKRKEIEKFVAQFPADQKPLESALVYDDSPRRIFWTRQPTPPGSPPPYIRASTTTTYSGEVAAWRTWQLNQKIHSAFSLLKSPPFNGLLQFWAPVLDETGPPQLPLSTSQQPFSLDDLDNPRLVEYRLSSITTRFQDDGLLAAFFRDPFSLAVLNLKSSAQKGGPLVNKAIDCGLTTLMLLPVFDPFIAPTGSCVGLVECCFNTSSGFHAMVRLLLDLILALETVGITTYHVRQSLPLEPTHGINLAKVEIEEALKIVCESLHLSLAQVWIDINTVNHVSCSSPDPHNMEDEDHPKQPAGQYVVKFCGYTRCKQHPPADNDQYQAKLLDYYDMCDAAPFPMGKGLPGKTLQTHEPRFCKDLSNLTVKNGIHEMLCRMTGCSYLAICLRSTHTGKCVDYVFEFLWPQNRRNHIILLESILLTLKMCLPSFKFPSGVQLGDELRVLDVCNSTPGGSETLSTLKILQGNRFSQTPAKTFKEEGVPELHKQKLAKRRKFCSELYEEGKDQTDSDSDSDPADYVERRITAEYRKLTTVNKRLKLEPGIYQRWSISRMIKRNFSKKASSLTEQLPFKVPSSDPKNTTIVDNVSGKTEIVGYKEMAANDQGMKNGEQLLRFVHSMVCQAVPHRRIFWSKTRPEKESSMICTSLCSNLVDEADVWRRGMIHEKIKSAFCRVFTPRLHGLIQFWAPVVDETKSSSSSRLHAPISSSHQPFALEDLDDPCIWEYRLFSINYQIDDGGPHATAFLTHFPEVVQDIRMLDKEGRRSPLVDKALYCDLTCLILLPVFYHPHCCSHSDQSISGSSCVGVVECCIKPGGHLQVLPKLILALKSVGLTTYNVQQRLQYEPSNGLNHAKDEIEAALKIVCESLHLNLAQVWIDDDSVNHVRSSPSSPFHKEPKEDDSHDKMKQPGMFVVRLCGYLTHSNKDRDYDCFYEDDCDYYDTCDALPLKFGEGFVGKTLQTHEPYFCKDLSSLERQKGLFFRSGLALCLKSTHTGQGVDYAFEFLWSKNRNHSILLESILLTLKMCLPSFKFASGAQLGEEVQVLNVGSEYSSFKVLPGNRFSQTAEELVPILPKKFNDLYESDSQTDSESDVDTDANPDTDPLGCM